MVCDSFDCTAAKNAEITILFTNSLDRLTDYIEIGENKYQQLKE